MRNKAEIDTLNSKVVGMLDGRKFIQFTGG